MSNKNDKIHPAMPDPELVAKELGKAKSAEDFFGKDGIFSKLFSDTIETMLEAEMEDHLGYSRHSKEGYNSGNSRNGKYNRKLRTSQGDTQITVPRDRNGEYDSKVLENMNSATGELEEKVIAMYARGMSTRDISTNLEETFGVSVSADYISKATAKVIPLMEEWQSRPLDAVYPVLYLDCIHVKLRRDGKMQNTAIYIALAIDTEGKKQVLGHWAGDGGEGANFWLSVVSDLKNRGVEDILIVCVDGLKGFKEAIASVFDQAVVQRCIIHQIRYTLKFVSWKDKKQFMKDLKQVYKAVSKEQAEAKLVELSENWSDKYAVAVKSWEDNWEELSTYFQFTEEIRKLIYTTNLLEGYNRQIRKVAKTKANFPSSESILKLMYLATQNIEKKWTMPIKNWALILSQLAIRFEGRLNLSR